MIKNTYIQCSEFKAHSVFQSRRKSLKNPECEKYIQYSVFIVYSLGYHPCNLGQCNLYQSLDRL